MNSRTPLRAEGTTVPSALFVTLETKETGDDMLHDIMSIIAGYGWIAIFIYLMNRWYKGRW